MNKVQLNGTNWCVPREGIAEHADHVAFHLRDDAPREPGIYTRFVTAFWGKPSLLADANTNEHERL